MKKKMFVIFLLTAQFSLWAKNDHLIPYELDGKIGFLNQDMKKIVEPKYRKLTEISTYCAVVQTVAADWMIVTFDRTEIPIKSVQNFYLIGDEYFADLENCRRIPSTESRQQFAL